MSDGWFYTTDKKSKHGPVTAEQLRALVRSGKLGPTSLVCKAGEKAWRSVDAILVQKKPAANVTSSPRVPHPVAAPARRSAWPMKTLAVVATVGISCAFIAYLVLSPSKPTAEAPAHKEKFDEKAHGKDDWRTIDARLALENVELLARLSAEQRKELAEATRLHEKAHWHNLRFEYKEGIRLASQALEIRQILLGERHPDHTRSLVVLAQSVFLKGDQDRAQSLLDKALEVWKQSVGEQHPEYAAVLRHLGTLFEVQFELDRALSFCERALEISARTTGEESLLHADCLNLRARLFTRAGQAGRAIPLLEKALAIRQAKLDEKHPDYATALNNLAIAYTAKGDLDQSKPLLEKAVELRKATMGERNPYYATSLSGLATIYQRQGDTARAIGMLEQARAIHKEALGESHSRCVGVTKQLYTLYLSQGDLTKAHALLESEVEAFEHSNVGNRLQHANCLWLLAQYYRMQGDLARAAPLYEKALQVLEQHREVVAAYQSDRQQLKMAQNRRFLDDYLSLAALARLPPATSYAAALRWKGTVFQRQRQLRLNRDILEEQAPDVSKRFAELETVSRRLASLALTDVAADEAPEQAKELAELSREKERLERELSRLSAAFRSRSESMRHTPDQLCASLPPGAVLVDFLVYYHSRPNPKKVGFVGFVGGPRLTAFVVRSDRDVVRVDLGLVKPIVEAVEAWRPTVKRVRPTQGETDPAVALRRLVWQPLEKHLDRATTVLISPDGPLARLPFAALPGSDPTKYLIEEFGLAIVPVPQLLPELLAGGAKPKSKEPSLLLVGDVDFDAEPGNGPAGDSVSRETGSARRLWKRLEGTRGEVATIRDSFEQRFNGENVKLLRGAFATEQTVRQQAPRYRYLHLATHGFFAPPEQKSAPSANPNPGDEEAGDDYFGKDGVAAFHPGLLSGLVLAGANRKPEPGQDDGILTALEVGELDLRQTELAVLSACETGLGQTAGGEGLLGLQRAFQLAGARATVASLWSVDDEATRKLMERFYVNLWEKKMSKLEALREAQRWMLTEGLKRGLVREDVPEKAADARTPPYFWAAFVLSGDWR